MALQLKSRLVRSRTGSTYKQQERTSLTCTCMQCILAPSNLEVNAGSSQAHRILDVHPVRIVLTVVAHVHNVPALGKLFHDQIQLARLEAKYGDPNIFVRGGSGAAPRRSPVARLLARTARLWLLHCCAGRSNSSSWCVHIRHAQRSRAAWDMQCMEPCILFAASLPHSCLPPCTQMASSTNACGTISFWGCQPAGESSMLCEGGGGGSASRMLPVGVRLRRRGVVPPSAWLRARP